MWPFRKKKNSFLPALLAKKGVKKVDKLATGVVLWGILASIYGYKAWSKRQLEEPTLQEKKPWYKRFFRKKQKEHE